MITYDPLAALGVRIGSPEQDAFLTEHTALLKDDFGVDFVSDLTAALRGDLPAAWRVADTLAPSAIFTWGEKSSDGVSVAFTRGSLNGRVNLKAVPPLVGTQAMVLVSAAISIVNHDALREIHG